MAGLITTSEKIKTTKPCAAKCKVTRSWARRGFWRSNCEGLFLLCMDLLSHWWSDCSFILNLLGLVKYLVLGSLIQDAYVISIGSGGKGRLLWQTYCNTGFCVTVSFHYDGLQPLLLHLGNFLILHVHLVTKILSCLESEGCQLLGNASYDRMHIGNLCLWVVVLKGLWSLFNTKSIHQELGN